ncbi:MAG: S10 family serine carboxypeptidase-like protein [Bacillota bacterium]|jgi:carboxypeptidase C (cathepsin A)
MLKTDAFTPSRFTGEGSITLRGKVIPYHTVSEDNVFYDDEGKAIASIFSYSYFRSDVEDVKSRPVLFCFNGGPGTSSMMVHVGFLGTKRIKYSDDIDEDGIPLPPYESCDNAQCLLDIADIVLVDPVGTGFGRLLDESKKDLFWGIEPDAEALLTFIQMWLARYNRWQSPKYLVGESYGCTRASTAAAIGTLGGADRAYSVTFDGLIMIGNTVSPGKFFADKKDVYPAVLAFPTLAAVNWYHNHPSEQTVEEFVAEAKQFADTEYLLALYQGESLQGDAREHIIERVIYYTGVSREYLERRALFVDDVEFRSQVLRHKGRAVARLDGRITRPLYSPLQDEMTWGIRDDGSQGKYDSFFQSVLCGEVFPLLGIKNWDRNFVNSAGLYGKWNNDIKGRNTSLSLSSAMRRVPTMRTFFINGWYDICTQFGILWYTLNHAGLPMDRIFVKGYKAGHMSYLGEDNIQEVTDDMYKFILGNDPTK